MKIIVFLLTLTPITFALGAVILAYHNKDGWGWCILASLLSGVSVHNSSKQN